MRSAPVCNSAEAFSAAMNWACGSTVGTVPSGNQISRGSPVARLRRIAHSFCSTTPDFIPGPSGTLP